MYPLFLTRHLITKNIVTIIRMQLPRGCVTFWLVGTSFRGFEQLNIWELLRFCLLTGEALEGAEGQLQRLAVGEGEGHGLPGPRCGSGAGKVQPAGLLLDRLGEELVVGDELLLRGLGDELRLRPLRLVHGHQLELGLLLRHRLLNELELRLRLDDGSGRGLRLVLLLLVPDGVLGQPERLGGGLQLLQGPLLQRQLALLQLPLLLLQVQQLSLMRKNGQR